MSDDQSKVLEDLLRTSRAAKQEDLAFVETMQRLVKNPDFVVYLDKVIGSRLVSFGAMMLEPSGSIDGLVKTEFVKGAMFAFCLARDLPSVMIQSMSEMRPEVETERNSQ